jgi:hypothetical protein
MAQLRNTQSVLSGIGTDRPARRGGPPHSTAGAGGARDDMTDHDETAETETQIRQTPN